MAAEQQQNWLRRRVCVPCKLAVRASYAYDDCPVCNGPLEHRELVPCGPFRLRPINDNINPEDDHAPTT